ncbi:hypothetical protein [Pediococcus pentosaceus]|uniref:hypothetical protein n=1 Tax=Pediococcus pentosaceus TaxID=1255 RepID=UPI00031FF7D8|nr:hypothetical protein [Pediococcus pentosaceus]MCV3319163.1 hypothetical protein [Pediococcus pentosaceus]
MTVNKNRLSDDKYPMLMDKKTVAEYLGVSKSSVDVFLLNNNLSTATFEPSKLNRNFFIKTKVNKWLEEL